MPDERFRVECVYHLTFREIAMCVFASASASASSFHSFSAVHVVRSALAFERILDRSRIEAFYEDDFLVLEGHADCVEAIDRAMELARSLTSCHVVNHIEAAY
jgi:hypothetical protein